MNIPNAAVALGRLGGKVKSKAKAAASRANGAKSKGWPKGKKRGPRRLMVECGACGKLLRTNQT